MKILMTTVVGAAVALAGCSAGSRESQADSDMKLLVGSYCEPGDSALRVFSFNEADTSGRLLYTVDVDNASFFTQAPSGTVYAVTERGDSDSYLTALRPDSVTGLLKIVNSRPTLSGGPCYVEVSSDARFAVTANYGGGTISVFPIAADGSLLPVTWQAVFDGNGPVERRQASPHPHCIAFTPDGRYMLVNDLGTDRIHMFAAAGDSLSRPERIGEIDIIPGSGPRHIVFNKSGDIAYLINEISDSVTVLRYNGHTLEPVQYIAADTAEAHGAGDIHLSPDGRHLYVSLRLRHDGIATFAVDEATGLLTLKGHTPTGGHPRNFAISPGGRLMLVACRDANAVEIYAIDPVTGMPAPSGRRIDVPRPVCVKFLRPHAEVSK